MKVSLILVSIFVSLILLVNFSQTESLQKKGVSLISSGLSAFSSSAISPLTSSVSTFAAGVSNTSRGVISSLSLGHFRAGLKTNKKEGVVPGKPIYGRFKHSLIVSFGISLRYLFKNYKSESESESKSKSKLESELELELELELESESESEPESELESEPGLGLKLLWFIVSFIVQTPIIYALCSLFNYNGPVYTREMFEDIEEFEKNELNLTASKEDD